MQYKSNQSAEMISLFTDKGRLDSITFYCHGS